MTGARTTGPLWVSAVAGMLLVTAGTGCKLAVQYRLDEGPPDPLRPARPMTPVAVAPSPASSGPAIGPGNPAARFTLAAAPAPTAPASPAPPATGAKTLRLRSARGVWVYVVRTAPDGKVTCVFPSPTVHNESEFLDPGDEVAVPVPAGAGTLTIVASEDQLHRLAAAVKGGIREPAHVKGSLHNLRLRSEKHAVQADAVADGWTELWLKQAGITAVIVHDVPVR